YPHLSKIIPLMAQKKILPYLDVPFQHSHPDVLKRMRRPAQNNNSINLIKSWRKDEPEIAIRSTFIVGYPGETEVEFQHLLDWLGEVKLDRVGCFKYNNVKGAKANELPGHIDDETKQDRWDRFMTKAQQLSEAKLQSKIGTVQTVIVDEVDADGAVCRTMADAPEIDGNLFIDRNFSQLKPGQIVNVKVDESNEYDLWGSPVH
ncbi:MAG: 30S ribosomal protein S12 methylthiotransferase RimO, partial [Pseudomonadota bacterium]|nr:30S ribosomal protein S12 methylthiotransferase RimO [Pseudomonadota bacterium]